MGVREFRIAGGLEQIENIEEGGPPETYFDVKPRNIKFPKEFYKHLDRTVIGQDDAKKALSSALFESNMRSRHDSNDKHPRLLLVGPTGCGKTMLINSLKELEGYFVIVIDSSQLTGNGWAGDTKFYNEFLRQLTTILEDKYGTEIPTDVLATLSDRVILVLDEFDKLSEHKAVNNKNYDYKKIIQDEMLTFIDGVRAQIRFKINDVSFRPIIDTKRFLIIIAGAFQDLHKTEIKQHSIGFFAAASTEDNNNKKINKNTLEEHGIMRELLGRIDRVITLHALSADNYKAILKEQILREYVDIFNEANINVYFTDAWIDQVIASCTKKLEGARALREIVQELLAPYIFNIEDYQDLLVIDVENEKKLVLKP